MDGRSVAPLAVFLEFEFLGLLLLVDGGGVVAVLALCAGESDYVCHVKLCLLMKCENGEYFSTAGIIHCIIFRIP